MINPARWNLYASDPSKFRSDIVIDRDGTPTELGTCLDPWQAADFAALDPGWMRVVGHEPPASLGKVYLRAYLERPRGHSKTSDLALMVVWALVFATRPVRGFATAADKDQARLLRDAIQTLIRLNPLLSKILEVQNYVVRNVSTGPAQGSQLEILSSDVGSNYGLLGDFFVVDEITHWTGDDEQWNSIFSSAAKRTSMLVVISNAGCNMGDCWQWTNRTNAAESDHWYFDSLSGPHASWISKESLAEQERILPPAVFRRLWLNQWSQGGDAIDAELIDASVLPDAVPMAGDEKGYEFAAGLDLSTKRDRSGFTVLGAQYDSHRVRLAFAQSWSPRKGGTVDLDDVEQTILTMHKRFRKLEVYYDPHQAVLMAQQLSRRGVRMIEMPFVGQNLTVMAASVLSAFRQRKVDLFPHPELVRDLKRLSIEEKAFGFKLTAPRDSSGHADLGMAFAIGLPRALELAERRRPRLMVAGPGPSASTEKAIPLGAWGIHGQIRNLYRG